MSFGPLGPPSASPPGFDSIHLDHHAGGDSGFRVTGAAIVLAVQEVGTNEVELAALGARRVGLQYLHVPGVGFDSQGPGCRIEG